MKTKHVNLIFYSSLFVFVVTAIFVTRHNLRLVKSNNNILVIAAIQHHLNKAHSNLYTMLGLMERPLTNELVIEKENIRSYVSVKNEMIGDLVLIDEMYRQLGEQNTPDSLILFFEDHIALFDSIFLTGSTQIIKDETQYAQILKELFKIGEAIDEQLNVLFDLQQLPKKGSADPNATIYVLLVGYVLVFIALVFSFSRLRNEVKNRSDKERKILKQAQVLRQLNKTKDTFFSIIAHDLRGPFNSLLNLFNILNEALEHNDLKMVSQNIQHIEFAARRTYNLLQNLLEWSKLQTGNINTQPEYFDIKILVKENMELFKEAAKQKNITLKAPEESQMVYADQNMINTVLRNLVQNAMKFTQQGQIEVTYQESNGFLTVRVNDSGVGIEKSDQELLFRIDANVKLINNSSDKGSGLGLILCKSFVDKNGGNIWVESKYGTGSTFCFTVPQKRNIFLMNLKA
jgi:signal transduction histidine kinase